jgi:hypothetical protein
LSRTKVILERPKLDAATVATNMPELTQFIASLHRDRAAAVTQALLDLLTLRTVEIDAGNEMLLVGALRHLSQKLPRSKFLVRGNPEDRDRWAYDMAKGVVTLHDDRPKPKKASADTARVLAQTADAKQYAVSVRFEIGEVLEHPKFGRGVVTGSVANKVVVQFTDAERTLVQATA